MQEVRAELRRCRVASIIHLDDLVDHLEESASSASSCPWWPTTGSATVWRPEPRRSELSRFAAPIFRAASLFRAGSWRDNRLTPAALGTGWAVHHEGEPQLTRACCRAGGHGAGQRRAGGQRQPGKARTGDTQTYRWVDKDGVVHFGDHVPPEYATTRSAGSQRLRRAHSQRGRRQDRRTDRGGKGRRQDRSPMSARRPSWPPGATRCCSTPTCRWRRSSRCATGAWS